jgi:hypothetical protein
MEKADIDIYYSKVSEKKAEEIIVIQSVKRNKSRIVD